MNNTISSVAVHSPNDGPLLQRLHDELVEAGMKSDVNWNKQHNPAVFNGESLISFWTSEEYQKRSIWNFTLFVGALKSGMLFLPQDGDADTHLDLTASNFQEVKEEIIKAFKS